MLKALKMMAASLVIGAATLGVAQADEKVNAAMQTLKAEVNALGTPKAENGKLYFGSTLMNDNFAIVDKVKEKHGGTATLFVKDGNSYIRVTTNVIKNGNRAVGTKLDPKGAAIAEIDNNKAFYGIVDILGKLYETGYEPIKDDKGNTVGIYYVGYLAE